MGLHSFDAVAAEQIEHWIRQRLTEPVASGSVATAAELSAALGSPSVTGQGLGFEAAWHRFTEVLAPATLGLSSERFLAFIPAAPSASAAMMDALVSVASFSGESWSEAAGAVHAENEVLCWLAEVAGLPAQAGGAFVSGGSAGNLSALAVARSSAGRRSSVLVADSAHSSVANALRLLGMPAVVVPTGRDGRLVVSAAADVITDDVGVIVASAGSTNGGVIDDLEGLAALGDQRGLWLHVDGAYGGAGLLVPSLRQLFAGIERADSLIIDPHKWLFSPLGSCALIYRDPSLAQAVHAQHAPYLDTIHGDGGWNPADYAFQLTRRASGLALWFALAVYGVDAHAEAVSRGVELARYAGDRIRSAGPHVELVIEPSLSVVLFRRVGWLAEDWALWSATLRDDGVAIVTPTTWMGETVGRLVFLHPDTPETLIDEILARLDPDPPVQPGSVAGGE